MPLARARTHASFPAWPPSASAAPETLIALLPWPHAPPQQQPVEVRPRYAPPRPPVSRPRPRAVLPRPIAGQPHPTRDCPRPCPRRLTGFALLFRNFALILRSLPDRLGLRAVLLRVFSHCICRARLAISVHGYLGSEAGVVLTPPRVAALLAASPTALHGVRMLFHPLVRRVVASSTKRVVLPAAL
jgi:hypothetical protein